MNPIRVIALVVFALGLVRDSASQTTGTFEVTTDRATYAPLDTVAVTFVNDRGAVAFVMNVGCGLHGGGWLPSFRIEQRVEGGWVPFSPGYACYAVAVPPTEVPAGGAYEVRFPVGVIPPMPSGTYRYVFGVTDEARVSPLPVEERTTAPFEVTR